MATNNQESCCKSSGSSSSSPTFQNQFRKSSKSKWKRSASSLDQTEPERPELILHPPKLDSLRNYPMGWAEKKVTPAMPDVLIDLKTRSSRAPESAQRRPSGLKLSRLLRIFIRASGHSSRWQQCSFGTFDELRPSNPNPIRPRGLQAAPTCISQLRIRILSRMDSFPDAPTSTVRPQLRACQMARHYRPLKVVWKNRRYFFIYHGRGIKFEPLEVTLDLERKGQEVGDALEINSREQKSQELETFMKGFPDWTYKLGWAASTHIYRIP